MNHLQTRPWKLISKWKELNKYRWWFSQMWGLTFLPGSPRAPSFPWKQTRSCIWCLLGNSCMSLWNVSQWNHVSSVIAPNWINHTFSPCGPLGPGKPWSTLKKKKKFSVLIKVQLWKYCTYKCVQSFTLSPGDPEVPGFPASPWEDRNVQKAI